MRRSHVRAASVVAVCLGTLLPAGCGPPNGMPPAGTVRGTVRYQGKPVTTANVVFFPAAGDSREGVAKLAADGTYTAYECPPGATKVVVVASDPRSAGPRGPSLPKGAKVPPEVAAAANAPPPPPAVKLPAKYASKDTTPLTFTVVEGKESVFDIELTD